MTVFAIFCGSRDWADREMIRADLRSLPPDATVIHGAAPGADSIAGFEADLLGLDVIEVPAEWGAHQEAAGPLRNTQMLKMLLLARRLGQEVRVYAYHEDPGLGRGTKNMVSQAREASVPVHIRLLEGPK